LTNDIFASITAADQLWARTATADPERRELCLKILNRMRCELVQMERQRIVGRTTFALWHPEGVVRKAFLNDRQL
jgi:hypothetical protein